MVSEHQPAACSPKRADLVAALGETTGELFTSQKGMHHCLNVCHSRYRDLTDSFMSQLEVDRLHRQSRFSTNASAHAQKSEWSTNPARKAARHRETASPTHSAEAFLDGNMVSRAVIERLETAFLVSLASLVLSCGIQDQQHFLIEVRCACMTASMTAHCWRQMLLRTLHSPTLACRTRF